MSNKTYDILKWIVITVLPALLTLFGVIGPPKPNQNYENDKVFATPCEVLVKLSPDRSQHSSGTHDHPAVTHAESPSADSTAQGKCQGCHLINSTQALRDRSKRC